MEIELVKRFVNDEKLPIQPIKSQEYFDYMLSLFEPTHQTRTKWEEWQRVIKENFNGDTEAYLASFYKMRDNIIKTMKSNEDFLRFNNCDMNQYRVTDIPQVGSGSVYKVPNSGKYYLSVDLKKANYQALHYAGVIKENSYYDWIKTFTDLEHLAVSKYLRVVVFGQLNPGRHITLEKYITAKIFKSISLNNPDLGNVVSIANDEIIWETESYVPSDKCLEIAGFVKDREGFDVTVESFRLRALKLTQNNGFNERSLDFYRKDFMEYGSTYHCIPILYYPIILKLLNQKPIVEFDRWFEHDGMLSQFIGNFKLEEINGIKD